MSYTPPILPTAFTWDQTQPYSAPTIPAAFTWVGSEGPEASGWSATLFGVPSAVLPATGWAVPFFGTPLGALIYQAASYIDVAQFGQPLVPFATGWSPTTFSIPTVALKATSLPVPAFGAVLGHQFWPHANVGAEVAFGEHAVRPAAVGFLASKFSSHSAVLYALPIYSTSFGAVSGFQFWAQYVPWSPNTRFGVPEAGFRDKTAVARGFAARFGIPVRLVSSTVGYSFTGRASNLGSARIGRPIAPYAQAGAAQPFAVRGFGAPERTYGIKAVFGVHRAMAAQLAHPLPHVTWPTPEAARSYLHSAPLRCLFGEPRSQRTHPVEAFSRQPRFGSPRSGQTRSYRTYGFRRTWFGRPAAIADPRAAASLASATFGAPASTQAHIALHIPPHTQYGTPLMKRFI